MTSKPHSSATLLRELGLSCDQELPCHSHSLETAVIRVLLWPPPADPCMPHLLGCITTWMLVPCLLVFTNLITRAIIRWLQRTQLLISTSACQEKQQARSSVSLPSFKSHVNTDWTQTPFRTKPAVESRTRGLLLSPAVQGDTPEGSCVTHIAITHLGQLYQNGKKK